MNVYEQKTKIVFGTDALTYLEQFKTKRVFVVTDPFMVKSGMIDQVTRFLSSGSFEVFSDIVPDPPMELVVKGVEKVTDYQPEIVLAIGGGSAIDAAKAIMHFSKKIGNLADMLFVAVPTTSGTGSEVTSFAVITDQAKGIKYPLVSDELIPDVAILEPQLVKSVPPAIVADTGMDVLTHALEAYVSVRATDFSDAFAQKAVELVFAFLLRSYHDKDDNEAKEKMHDASCLAGIAFNLAGLGINHAIAHNVGGKLHVPHGRTNALLLPHVIEFNSHMVGYSPKDYSKAAIRYAHLAKLVGIQGSTVRNAVHNLISEIIRMQREMKMPATLKECGITQEQLNESKKDIASAALKDACLVDNPRIATSFDVLEILHKIS